MTRDRFLCLFIAVASIGFAACGEEAPQEVVETGGDATEAPEEETEEELDSASEAFGRKDCLKVAEAMTGAVGGMGADLDADFDKAIDGLRRAGDAAPEEIRDDFGIFADAMVEYLEILRDADIDFNDPATFSAPKAQQAVKKATAVLEAPEVKQAQENIDQAMTDLCGGQ